MERNVHTSFLHRDQTDICELPEQMEYVEEIETGGDGLFHDQARASRTGEDHARGDHNCTNDDTYRNLPSADTRRGLPASTGERSPPPDAVDTPMVYRETIVHNRHLCREIEGANRTAAMTK